MHCDLINSSININGGGEGLSAIGSPLVSTNQSSEGGTLNSHVSYKDKGPPSPPPIVPPALPIGVYTDLVQGEGGESCGRVEDVKSYDSRSQILAQHSAGGLGLEGGSGSNSDSDSLRASLKVSL